VVDGESARAECSSTGGFVLNAHKGAPRCPTGAPAAARPRRGSGRGKLGRMNSTPFRAVLGATLLATLGLGAAPAAIAASDAEAIAVQKATRPDHSGKKRVGKASYYHSMFNGRKMAGGKRFDPNGANAASKTLPLGTVARVTNLENGKSAIVAIQDRGPYVEDRIVDLSPKTAQQIGITHQGVGRVEVAPLSVPLPDGRVIAGEAAREPGIDVVASR
jgi:rare lipoprotein A